MRTMLLKKKVLNGMEPKNERVVTSLHWKETLIINFRKTPSKLASLD